MNVTAINLDQAYRPTDDEPFMNERQRDYFRAQAPRPGRRRSSARASDTLQAPPGRHPSTCPIIADRASSETDRAIELQGPRPPAQADRQDRRGAQAARRRLIRLLRGDRRADLAEAASTPGRSATLSIEAQERHERRERVYRDE
jgi:DnaK suppressor protein